MDGLANNTFSLDLSDDSDLVDEHDEEDGVFTIHTPLLPFDGNTNYRTRNSKTDPYQRLIGTDRRGVVNIRCKILDIVHGTMSPKDPESFASLIVFRCAFFSKKHSRRVEIADVEFVFTGLGEDAPDPEVATMAPHGKYCLMPETEEQTTTREASGGITLPVVGGLGGEGGLKWQKVGTRLRKKYTTVIGEPGIVGRDEGPQNAAAWSLQENPDTREGVPEAFKGVILLERKDAESHFQCDLNITVSTNRWTSFASIFKSTSSDDPILFDPKRPSTDNLEVYDTNNLADKRLMSLGDINIMKRKSGIIEEDRA
ncbi:hypothetical protein KJ359_011755 [Pestalotiopsis sp. 9143b]|nr:hypothetical protein KJ359_011755 [Pestalotiopsis sp. 9143b]